VLLAVIEGLRPAAGVRILVAAAKVAASLKRAVAGLQRKISGLKAEMVGEGWHIVVPDKYCFRNRK